MMGVHNHYNGLQLYANDRLKQGLSLVVECKSMGTPDLANLTNQLFCTSDEPSLGKSGKILDF